MRKLLVSALAASALVPSLATAQSAGEVRHDRQEIRRDRNEVQRDLRNGQHREAGEDRRELREDRRELREDWRDYRNSHRSVYRRGAYYGPRGYSYRIVNPGFRFQSSYFGSRYWINDPWRYRLDSPARGLRWIRYGNDAILINARTGIVIRVYRDFFW